MPEWTPQREKVYLDRYSLKNEKGEPTETIEQTWDRVANDIGNNKKERQAFRRILSDFKFVPGGRILAGAGTDTEVTYYNCFVIGIKNTTSPKNGRDSREAIFDTISRMVNIMSRGGGVGINWSILRPNGSYLKRINGTTTGPIEWMDVASKAVGAVMQGGSRRGAAMFMLDDWHPDVLSFINAKRDLGKITNANISVAISDDFMKAVAEDGPWTLRFPDTTFERYNDEWDGDLRKWEAAGYPTTIHRLCQAREIWRELAEGAWDNGEPGVIFMDRYNNLSTGAAIERIACVNPCVSGDTLIATLDGNKPISELVGTTPLVYSFDPKSKKSVVRQAIRVWKTRDSAETIRITLDSGTVLTVTPNHNLYVFKGRYGVKKMQAKDIRVGFSLKAYGVSETVKEPGRLRIHNWPEPHSWVSREVWEAYNGPVPEGMVVHHVDHDPSNNDIENLSLISAYDHQSHHYAQRVKGGFGRHGWKTRPASANHKVVAIDSGPTIPVYNMTVDDTHTYVIADRAPRGKSFLTGIVSANCGEQGLGEDSVCNLGAMNLAAYLKDGSFQWESFATDVRTAVAFLDNVVDKNYYGDFEATKARQMQLRRIGLSVMGLADALIYQGIRYGSADSVAFVEDVFRTMKKSAIESSMNLAREKGTALGWSPEMANRPYLQDFHTEQMDAFGMRNLFLLTQAPTGTTSILAGVNSGIEPYFAFHYTRQDRTGTWEVEAPILKDYKDHTADWSGIPDYFVTSLDLSAEEHILVQAAAQKYIDSSVSKTINAPNSHTIEDVEKAYTLAYESGLKSIAYFRDGCGRDQVLERPSEEKPPVTKLNGFDYKRPHALVGQTSKVQTDVGPAFITINRDDDGNPIEVFVNVGKAGTDLQSLSEAIGRLISSGLQEGIPSRRIHDQLLGVGGYGKLVKSLPSAIAWALADSEPQGERLEVNLASGEACPECQALSLNHTEGCLTCMNCGYSRC